MARLATGPLVPEQASSFSQFLASLAFRPAVVLGSYRRQDLRPDLVAGITVAAVAIPQAIAYASIAELPPHFGLYTAGVAAVVGSLWGSSRHLATGPVNAVSSLVLPVLLAVDVPGSPRFLLAASALAVMVGRSAAGHPQHPRSPVLRGRLPHRGGAQAQHRAPPRPALPAVEDARRRHLRPQRDRDARVDRQDLSRAGG
jgi:hypothetical protein